MVSWRSDLQPQPDRARIAQLEAKVREAQDKAANAWKPLRIAGQVSTPERAAELRRKLSADMALAVEEPVYKREYLSPDESVLFAEKLKQQERVRHTTTGRRMGKQNARVSMEQWCRDMGIPVRDEGP